MKGLGMIGYQSNFYIDALFRNRERLFPLIGIRDFTRIFIPRKQLRLCIMKDEILHIHQILIGIGNRGSELGTEM